MAVTPGAIPLGTTALILKKGTYVPIEGTLGTFIDTTTITQPDGTVVNRTTTVIGDPENADNIAAVDLNGLSSQAGLVVRDPRMDDVVTCLNTLTEELQMIRHHLNLITEFEA